MKRALAVLAVPFLFACGETPTQPPLDVQPQLATEIGSGATWYFEGVILGALDPNLVDKPVSGSLTFEIASGDILPDEPCIASYTVNSSVTYTLDGEVYTLGGSAGQALSFTSCDTPATPWVLVNAIDGRMWVGQIELANPADTEDFPLVPPAVSGWPNVFTVWDGSPDVPDGERYYFHASLTSVYSSPQTKADCMNDGWLGYGFKNQGQCVRYVETGKDSR